MATADARVVINEVFYHAPDDIEDLEYIELHNSRDHAVDLTGWAFTKGIKFKFAAGTRIDPKGFLVLCRNQEHFQKFYAIPTAGVFDQPLSNKGERLELSDASGQVADSVKYQDDLPWPMGADGLSGSLERISPEGRGDDVFNWASSPLSEDRVKPAGTPGKVNANFSGHLPPVIRNVTFEPENPAPDQPIVVQAEVADAAEVALLYRIAGPGFEKPESLQAMERISEGRYAASIPGQVKDQLIRFRIRAINAKGARRFFPGETEPRPALSAYVHERVDAATVPFGWVINTTEAEAKGFAQRASGPTGPFRGFNPDELARTRLRMTVESNLDWPAAWFELTVNGRSNLDNVQKLKQVFAAKLVERDKLIDDMLESSRTEEKLQALPEIMKTFGQSLVDSLKPHLIDEQEKSFTEWLAKQQAQTQPSRAAPGGTLFANPNAIVKNWVKLEGAWYAISVKSEIDEPRLADQHKIFQELAGERNALAAQAAGLRQLDEDYRQLRERGEALEQKLVSKLKAVLSRPQEAQFQAWRANPNSVSAPSGGLAGPPGDFGAPRGGFGGGAPGRRGGPPGGFGAPREGFRGGPFGFRRGPAGPTSHQSAFVYFHHATQKIELFDFIQVVPRAGGQKVHFHKDKPLNKMSTVNLIFENEGAVLVEPLAYEVYRKAGMAAPQSYHLRLWLNGEPLGYYLLVEQPNRAFLRRNQLSDDGNLYKLLWYERGVVGQHEKKTHSHDGHNDIVALVEGLEKLEGEAQWEFIQKHFDVPQVVNYFAVNTVLSHWDGFFNNYFTYHDVAGTGKWSMYPWDQDNTWGMVMGMMGRGEVFYDMPITFGMKGDVPPGRREAPRGPGGGLGFGFGGGRGAGWWRAPGFFSGPLLANAQFRKLFLTRTKEIAETLYTEEVMGPMLDNTNERLKPEVQLRAELLRNDPNRALQNLEQNFQALRNHLKKRREFLLSQDEIKNVGTTP